MGEAQAAAADHGAELAGNRGLNPDFERKLLIRAEDAGLNASAPPQQLWLDGWLVRFSPGKAKRARCINAVASGRLSVVHKLARAEAVFAGAQLPMVVRITPFTRPSATNSLAPTSATAHRRRQLRRARACARPTAARSPPR